MKIAGRRNDGAWYRTNLAIRALDAAGQTSLQALIVNIPTLAGFYTAVKDLSNSVKAPASSVPASAAALATIYSTTGIPRQVWMGVWSYDTYGGGGGNPPAAYAKNHATPAYAFAVDLRAALKTWFFGSRQVYDLVNSRTRAQGNPGGIANAHKGD